MYSSVIPLVFPLVEHVVVSRQAFLRYSTLGISEVLLEYSSVSGGAKVLHI